MPPAKPNFRASLCLRVLASLCLAVPLHAQDTKPTPADKLTPAVQTPAQIELLETLIRFELNGDSRKEVHARVHINNEIGARQFALLSFDYNRAFQKIEIPLLRITHASGGTADILPSATTDQPHPAVLNAPAYQDVRVKSVRLLGLAPGDILEYRVITSTSHHPLAPDFWIEHSFHHDGIVAQELFEVSVPSARKVRLYSSPALPANTIDESGDGPSPQVTYRWKYSLNSKFDGAQETGSAAEPEIVFTTYESWQQLCSSQLQVFFRNQMVIPPEVLAKALALSRAAPTADAKAEAIYDFVSQKIRTIDLPLGATGFQTRNPVEILSSGYATPEDKFVLFSALLDRVVTIPSPAFVSTAEIKNTSEFPRPSAFDHILTLIGFASNDRWVDLNLGVAPYGLIPSQLRGRHALVIHFKDEPWRRIPSNLPFPATQSVRVLASLASDGTLNAKVHYSMRGDNELLLRIAFHQAPREKWNEVAQLLALSDGFRGKIISAHASDPSATKQPFVVEYEISQPKFVDWSKKPVRIPALLPLLGLPESPDKSAANGSSPIDLGTPLDVQTQVTVQLPAGTGAEAPSGTSVDRDYATFSSSYNVQGGTVSAARHIHFLLRQIPGVRLADYNAFLHAVQTDQAQLFTLDRAAAATSAEPQPPRAAATPHP